MRFLRLLTNALLAGALSAAYLTILVLQLNPHVPLVSATALRWLLTLAAVYGLQLALAFYLLLVARELLGLAALSPGWASVRVLAWLSAAGAAVASLLMWLNVHAFRAGLSAAAAHRMTVAAAATAVAAGALLATALVHYSSGRRGGRVGAALFSLAAFGSLALPLAARGPAVPLAGAPHSRPVTEAIAAGADEGRRVVMLLLDGASLEYIRTQSTAGRLQHFSTLLDRGASMYLATVRPTQPDPVWATVATGMYPARHGVRSAARYYARGDLRPIHLLPDGCYAHALVRLGAIRGESYTSEEWGAPPLWRILESVGLPAGVVRLPMTDPAPDVRGFLVSDRFHDRLAHEAPVAEPAVAPAGLVDQARLALGASRPHAPGTADESVARRDALYAGALHALRSARETRFTALRLASIDAAGHRHYDDAQPSRLRDGSEQERAARARALARAYDQVDAELGRLLEIIRPGDLLLVVSGFGMQRVHVVKELLGRTWRDPVLRGTHERAPDGFLLAYGTPVAPRRLPRGSIVDVTPTVLYFFGVPIGRDMDGFARTDLFETAFTAGRPIAFIATHNR